MLQLLVGLDVWRHDSLIEPAEPRLEGAPRPLIGGARNAERRADNGGGGDPERYRRGAIEFAGPMNRDCARCCDADKRER